MRVYSTIVLIKGLPCRSLIPSLHNPSSGHEFATLAGGCFWCLEAVYEDLRGVIDVESGYSGGDLSRILTIAACVAATLATPRWYASSSIRPR